MTTDAAATGTTNPTLFRAYFDGTLPHIDFRSTREEAIELALDIAGEERHHAGDLIIEEVRTPQLGDFFDFGDLVSVMRERMTAMIGNDDALSDASVNDAVAKLVDHDIKLSLTAAAGLAGVRIDGYIVVNAEREARGQR